MMRGLAVRGPAIRSGVVAAVCLILVGGDGRSIGLAEKPQPEEPEQEIEAATGGAAAAAAAEQRRNRPEPEAKAPTADGALDPIGAEERLHLRRMARINRIQALGIEHERQRLVDLARRVRDAEQERHDLALQRLRRELERASGAER